MDFSPCRLTEEQKTRARGNFKGCQQLIIALLFFLVALPIFAAGDLISDRAYFEDPTNQLTFIQAKQQLFTQYQGVLAKGFSHSAFWLRLTIDTHRINAPRLNNDLIMLIRPSVLDEIQLYDPLDPASMPRLSGDTIDLSPIDNGLYRSFNLNFSIPQEEKPRDVWLRVKTTSNNIVDVGVYELGYSIRLNKNRELFYTFNIIFLVCFLTWALIHWLGSFDKLIGVFVIKQLLAIMWSILAYGYVRFIVGDLVPAYFIDKATSLVIILYTGSTFYFDYLLFLEYQSSKRGSKLLLLLMGCVLIELLLMASGATMRALQLNMVTTFLDPLFALIVAIGLTPALDHSDKQSPLISKKTLLAVYIVMFILAGPPTLAGMGFIPGTAFALSARMIHGLVSGALIIYLLYIRTRHIEQVTKKRMIELSVKEEDAEQEWNRQDEKSKFLAILAHDLKTPLAVAKMALGTNPLTDKHINFVHQAIDNMSAVIERCLQVAELEDHQMPLNFVTINIIDELKELQHKSIGAERIKIVGDAKLTVRSDAQILRIILSNVLDNAIKYSSFETPIKVNFAPAQQERLAGIEISMTNLPGKAGWPDPDRIFQKYYRSNYAQHLTGSGQGIYLVSQLAAILGGHIRYAPNQTHICFILWLPN